MATASAKVGVEVAPKEETSGSIKYGCESLDVRREIEPGVIHPNSSEFVQKFDIIVGTVLLYTALVTRKFSFVFDDASHLGLM